jgi:hypothetical protein
LTLEGSSLAHGIWSLNDAPPQSIPAGAQNVQWGSESDGLMTGTQGAVTYSLGAGGTVTLNWDNPYAGSNEYSSSVPAGFSCPYSGGDEDNTNVTFTLRMG